MNRCRLLFLIAHLLTITCYPLFLNGCATTASLISHPQSTGLPGGIYHRVEKGQTIYRLSKIYGVDIDELVRLNNISNVSVIEVGQMIFIPSGQIPKRQVFPASFTDDFIWPVRGRIISTFGSVSGNLVNRGIDIQPYTDKVVVAAKAGKVIFYSPHFYNYGKTIIIDHGDGFSSVYARNGQVYIKVGDYIQQGAAIATVGSAGRDRQEYLHFQIRKGYVPQNPRFYLP